ncbi:MAG: DUF4214 domain-containing protein [Chloroflexi bacterium]|nr:MAG: DUF4214 domain-containing protein [Chloroflexota bacterium]
MSRRPSARRAAMLIVALGAGILLAPKTSASTTAIAATAIAPPHVMVIMEEDKSPSDILGNAFAPYINDSLARNYASATNWFAVHHNSPLDYAALIAGFVPNWTTTVFNTYPDQTVVGELAAKGIGSRAYIEDMPSACDIADHGITGQYFPDHNPFVHFTSITGNASQCDQEVVPLASSFASDLSNGTAPPFMFVVPNACDDMHTPGPNDPSCGSSYNAVSQGDTWLSTHLPAVLASSWYQSGGTVIITFDEGSNSASWDGGSGGQIPTLVISSRARGAYTAGGDQFGILRAIEEDYGVPLLGSSADPAHGDLTGAGVMPSPGTRFVDRVYADLLNRAPDGGGLAYWSAQIDSGQPRYPISLSLTASVEYTGHAVQALYQRYLHRAADGTTSSGGEGFWVNYIRSGATYEQLAESLIASDEYFFNRAGGDDTTYVNTLYQDILGRAPDPAGLAYWVGQLEAGGPRAQVSAAILVSTEGYQDLVNSVFGKFLRRSPDAAGLAFWTVLLVSGVRDEQFIASIIGSAEYLQYGVGHFD